MHSNKYTIGFMAIVTVLLGSFLSVAAGSLKEMQDLNVENDSKKNILSSYFSVDPSLITKIENLQLIFFTFKFISSISFLRDCQSL